MAIDENEIKKILGQLEDADMEEEFQNQDARDFMDALGIGFHKDGDPPKHIEDFNKMHERLRDMEKKRQINQDKMQKKIDELRKTAQKSYQQPRPRQTFTPPPEKAARPPKPKGPTIKQRVTTSLNKEVDLTKIGFKNKVTVKTVLMDASIVAVGIAGLVYTLS